MKEWLIAIAVGAIVILCGIAALWLTGFMLYFGWQAASTIIIGSSLPNG